MSVARAAFPLHLASYHDSLLQAIYLNEAADGTIDHGALRVWQRVLRR
jgi:hypothetical protein